MGSSSRKKYPKKKSSKLSSKARKMKKSRRTKSRKHGRRHDSSTDNSMSSHSISSPSDSYFSDSDDDSISSKSVYTSSSKDTYRRSKASRSRSNVKKRKKQARKKSSIREESRDLSRSKKRKRSKQNGDSKSRKNSQRKKLKRDVGIHSASSDLRSCSTCDDSVSDSERSEGERVKRRSRDNNKATRDSHKSRVGSKLSARRSPSHSSHSGYRDENCSISHSEETFMAEKNSRRLKSVIIFAEKPDSCIREENEPENVMQKEELVYDHDDYPSKSSSGEGSKKLSTPCPRNALDGGVTELTESRINDYDQDHVCLPSSDEFETYTSIQESSSNIPLPDSGSHGNDLEAILKQKALENLKKFRGALKTRVKPTAPKYNDDRSVPSSSKVEIVQSKSLKQTGPIEVEVSDEGFSREVFGTAKQSPDNPPDVAHSGKEEGPPITPPVLGKSVMRNSSIRETSSGVGSKPGTKSSVVSANKNHIETQRSLRNSEHTVAQSKSLCISTNQGATCSSTVVESAATDKQSLNNEPDEAKDGSQYQQKTMSVMRGGEMVQVNYKVYIPKRAPALARRQFKR